MKEFIPLFFVIDDTTPVCREIYKNKLIINRIYINIFFILLFLMVR